MNKTFTIIGIICLFALASTLESYDAENIYNRCIDSYAASVYTDTQAEYVDMRCRSVSGY